MNRWIFWLPVSGLLFFFTFYTSNALLLSNETHMNHHLNLVSTRKSADDTIQYRSYEEIVQIMKDLTQQFPSLIQLFDTQSRYKLDSVGICEEYTSSKRNETIRTPCKQYFVVITDHKSWKGSGDESRPHMIISGELHGNERIGPQVTVELVRLLTSQFGKDPWLTELLKTRVLVIIPTTNAVGYSQNARYERGSDGKDLDPNRDFPFDQFPELCMRTVAARSLNEMFREFRFQLMLTFHGGANVIGYEWGDTSHCSGGSDGGLGAPSCSRAEDHSFMHALGLRMQSYAGTAGTFEKTYDLGSMGETVYPVKGGLEDWAYGASWYGNEIQCRPDTSKGLAAYPISKTTRNSDKQRCITYLIEAGNQKQPPENQLGSNVDMLSKTKGAGDGHISRNVRLSIAALDALRPTIQVVEGYPRLSSVGKNEQAWMIEVHFVVRGAFSVEQAFIQWSTPKSGHEVQSGASSSDHRTQLHLLSHDDPTNPESSADVMHASFYTPKSVRAGVYFRIVADVDASLFKSNTTMEPQSHIMRNRNSHPRVVSKTWQLITEGAVYARVEEESSGIGWGTNGQLYAQSSEGGAGNGEFWAGLASSDGESGGMHGNPDTKQWSIWTILAMSAAVLLVVAFLVMILIIILRRLFHSPRSPVNVNAGDPSDIEMQFLAEWEDTESSQSSSNHSSRHEFEE
uniref:Peptidase M14 domain-containing protein n=1 Tax=Timspurckia oligopyrenoides TaxID=708627 RepID=A0A7S0ZJS0_9RHOD|mmetsp:Transcript_7207/g.12991  ORF Transcript_7207/g.12991 Transcript_7207/m.12991 type:complete len:684 (+) Transcript_7207:2-2053(+)